MLGCFCVLSSFSYGTTATSRYVREVAKPVMIWRTEKAAQIADVWGITTEEVDQPIAIFSAY